MARAYDRDLIGYGPNPPDPKWPDGARLAVNFVMNYEEGSEPSVQDGEGFSESGLTEAHGLNQLSKGRDLAAETMFEYGSRVGFWRLMRLFQERRLPLTDYGGLPPEANWITATSLWAPQSPSFANSRRIMRLSEEAASSCFPGQTSDTIAMTRSVTRLTNAPWTRLNACWTPLVLLTSRLMASPCGRERW